MALLLLYRQTRKTKKTLVSDNLKPGFSRMENVRVTQVWVWKIGRLVILMTGHSRLWLTKLYTRNQDKHLSTAYSLLAFDYSFTKFKYYVIKRNNF